MPEAEGITRSFETIDAIRMDLLETIPYHGIPQVVTYETHEFSAVCPFSGLPDYGTFRMIYIPYDTIIELKSLKYYLTSYRNVGVYQEHATHQLFADLSEVLYPKHLHITTIYNTRGGIDTTCSINSDNLEDTL